MRRREEIMRPLNEKKWIAETEEVKEMRVEKNERGEGRKASLAFK